MTREQLIENVEKAKTSRDVALAEVAEANRTIIEAAEEALAQFDANADVADEVEEVVAETEVEGEVVEVTADEEVAAEVAEGVEEPVEETSPSEEVIAEDDEDSPTAEEEEVLRKAAEIEAKYKVSEEA